MNPFKPLHSLAHGGAKHWQTALDYLRQFADANPSAATGFNSIWTIYLVHAGQLESAMRKLQSFAKQTSDAGSVALTCSEVLKAIEESQSKFNPIEQSQAVAAVTDRGLRCVKQINEHPESSRRQLTDLLLDPRLQPLIETEAVQQWLAARKK